MALEAVQWTNDGPYGEWNFPNGIQLPTSAERGGGIKFPDVLDAMDEYEDDEEVEDVEMHEDRVGFEYQNPQMPMTLMNGYDLLNQNVPYSYTSHGSSVPSSEEDHPFMSSFEPPNPIFDVKMQGDAFASPTVYDSRSSKSPAAKKYLDPSYEESLTLPLPPEMPSPSTQIPSGWPVAPTPCFSVPSSISSASTISCPDYFCLPQGMPTELLESILPPPNVEPDWQCVCGQTEIESGMRCEDCGKNMKESFETKLARKEEELAAKAKENEDLRTQLKRLAHERDAVDSNDSAKPRSSPRKNSRKRRSAQPGDSPRVKKKHRVSTPRNTRPHSATKPRREMKSGERHVVKSKYKSFTTATESVICPINPRGHANKDAPDGETDEQFKARKLSYAKEVGSIMEELTMSKMPPEKVLKDAIQTHEDLEEAQKDGSINPQLGAQLRHVVNSARKTSKEDEFGLDSKVNPHIAMRDMWRRDVTLDKWLSEGLPKYYKQFIPQGTTFGIKTENTCRSATIAFGDTIAQRLPRSKRRTIIIESGVNSWQFAVVAYSNSTRKRWSQPTEFDCDRDSPRLGAAEQRIPLFEWDAAVPLHIWNDESHTGVSFQPVQGMFIGFYMMHDPWLCVVYLPKDCFNEQIMRVESSVDLPLTLVYMVKDGRAQPTRIEHKVLDAC